MNIRLSNNQSHIIFEDESLIIVAPFKKVLDTLVEKHGYEKYLIDMHGVECNRFCKNDNLLVLFDSMANVNEINLNMHLSSNSECQNAIIESITENRL